MQVGYLLFGNNCIYRVIGSGSQHVDVIEYTGKTSEERTLSQIKGEWYMWVNGVGKKINKLEQIAPGNPFRIPVPVFDFNQLEQAETLIIKGMAFEIVDEPAEKVPDNWSSSKIYNLFSKTGRALLGVKKMKRESLRDKGSSAELFQNDKIIRLSETDVWIMMSSE